MGYPQLICIKCMLMLKYEKNKITPEIWVLYPKIAEMTEIKPFESNDKVKINIFFVDLNMDINTDINKDNNRFVDKLYNKILEKN